MITVINMTTNEKIKYLRKRRSMSQQELAEAVGFRTASAVNKIEAGIRGISGTKLMEFAKALDTTPSYLLSPIQEEFVNPPSNLNCGERKVPLIGTIACGLPILAQENTEDMLALPPDIDADFALRCKGDSMINAHLFNGDIVYIRRQPDVENGDIAAVLIGDEATLKRVRKYPSKLILSPENPMYDDLVYENSRLDDVHILGKAVAFLGYIR